VGDFERIWEIVNDGARAYEGVIPADRYAHPYMSREKLRAEIADGVKFSGYEEDGVLAGVMGIQPVQDVTLIRHAYVATGSQKRGIGAKLLNHLVATPTTPILIGTWTDAVWAIRFYERYGFEVVDAEEKIRLLKRYWNIPERQVETSVVLADQQWRDRLHTR
jgi:N-acetylglutamate synthase-like GNAT family acetyltransferase